MRATLVLAVLAAAGAWSCGSSDSSPAAATTTPGTSGQVMITILGQDAGMSFSPPTASLQVGQTVVWHNADTIEHHPVQDGGANSGGGNSGYGGGSQPATGFDAGTLTGGATSAPITLRTAGTFGYHCAFHPTMVGTLKVGS